MSAVFLRILAFVIGIDLFYMSIGQFYLTQAEDHPPPVLEITVDTDIDTLLGMGETLMAGKGGCLLCHKITEQGNTRGPDLRGVGGRAASRRPGMSAEAYLRESLVDPGAYVVAEFATAGGASIMPAADRPPADLSPTEFKALLAFLQSLGGEVTVEITAEDVALAAAKQEEPPAPTSSHPGFALLTSQGCVACHDVTGTTVRIGPPLSNVAERLSAAEIRLSILEPDAVIAEGFQPGLMLQDFGQKLAPEELQQIVAYLSDEVTLAERLAHPAVHLAALILLFNVGIGVAIRAVGAAPRSSTHVFAWRQWGGVAVVIPFALALYVWERAESADRLAVTESTAQSAASATVAESEAPALAESGLPGEALFRVTCPACHGSDAKGVPGLGKDMTTSAFIAGLSDADLVEFIKRGRAADDPLNTTGLAMPPKGANVALSDAEMLQIVEYIRWLSN